MKETPYKIYLTEHELPTHWHNVRAAMKEQHDPMLHPGTMQPCVKEDLLPLFCSDLVDQELNSTDEFIEIPSEIRNFYKMYRPCPTARRPSPSSA